jgi:hypothetical protein
MLCVTTSADRELQRLASDVMPTAQGAPQMTRTNAVPAGQSAKGLRVLVRPRSQAGSRRPLWVLEFEPLAEPFAKPLVGWIGARVPLGGEQLDFLTKEEAIAFAQRHGWSTEIIEPPSSGRQHIPLAQRKPRDFGSNPSP